MSVRCGKCGEELLGAVNRCWRCGTQMVVSSQHTDLPPVRQSPVPVSVVNTDASAATAGDVELAESSVTATRPTRYGSPFAISADVSGHTSPASFRPTRSVSRYPRHAAAIGGAIASLVLGVLSLVVSLYTYMALPVAILGICMGIWGLYSRRRGLAVIGLVFCCIALIMSGFNGSIALFESIYGMKPWERPVQVIPGPDEF